jgi:hypothetical protein
VPSSPLAPEHRALLAAIGVTELPHPIPAGLLTLPIFRAAVKRGTPDATGQLPESAWRTRIVAAEPAGRFSVYDIAGDPRQGLPYGGDGDVLLALAALADTTDAEGRPYVDPTTGVFAAPSLRMIARVLGLEMSKDRAERIKGALERLAAVRIRVTRVRQLDGARTAELLALPPGNSYPIWLDAPGAAFPGAPRVARDAGDRAGGPAAATDVVDGVGARRRARAGGDPLAMPADGAWVTEAEASEYLITYAWRTDYHRSPRGEDWISKLTINPTLLAQGERGWVGWIDCPTHAKLTRPIAKRLYQLAATAEARQAPLRFELGALRQLCGIAAASPNVRTAHVRDDLLAAAAELSEHDVLAGAEAVEVARGRYVFHLEAGPRLKVAGWLRGLGRLDFTEQRVQRLLLASLDVAPRVAERLVAESAGQVQRMLAYVLYLRDRGRAVKAPGRYVVEGVAEGWSYETNDDFQRWLRERTQAARESLAIANGSGNGGGAAERGADGAPAHGEPPEEVSPDGRRRRRTATLGSPVASPVLSSGATDAGVDGDVGAQAHDAGPALELPAVPAEVAEWWRSVVATVAPTLHALPRAYLERVRPAAHAGVALLVVASSDGERDRLAREADRLAAAAAAVSGGAVCEVLVLSPQQWRARADDVAAGG